MVYSFHVKTGHHEEFVDITAEIQTIVKQSGIVSGICHAYTPHTTAALTINENADPAVQRDIVKGLGELHLEQARYQHLEGNSPAHIKSSLVGCSLTVFIEKGSLLLGTWQGIYFCEFDGPRSRQVHVKLANIP
jgi:secondary thiamine-phosphate synthase enzyme